MKLSDIVQYLNCELPINILMGVAESDVEFDFTGVELDTQFAKQLNHLIDNTNEKIMRSFIKSVVNESLVLDFLKDKSESLESETLKTVIDALRRSAVDLTDCQDEIFQIIQHLGLKKVVLLEKYSYLIDLAKLLDISIDTIKEGT